MEVMKNFWIGVNKNFFWKQVAIAVAIIILLLANGVLNNFTFFESIVAFLIYSVMAFMYPFAATSWNCLIKILFPNTIIFYNFLTLIILIPYIVLRTMILFIFGILIAPFGILYINNLVKKQTLQMQQEREFQESFIQENIVSALQRAGLTRQKEQ